VTVELITMPKEEFARMLDEALEAKLKPIRDKILHVPDETILSDDDAAQRLGVSVATLRRMKVDGRLHSIPTPRGRVVRVCDIVAKETGGLL
jgi:hypothetical protein